MNEWTKLGVELSEALDGIEDEETIKVACLEVVQKICDRYENLASRRNPLTEVRDGFRLKYPSTKTQTSPCQFFTDSGKGKIKRWEHLAIKHLSLSKQDWDELRGNPNQPETQTETLSETPLETQQIKEFTIKDMNINQLELDSETEGMVKQAIEQSGISLAEFIQKACQVYAKTVTGKARKFEEDLATVPTEKLLNDVAYSTHPGRPDELTKRAIRAIEIYNDEVATENKYRWCITQTIITELTGSRAESVKRIMNSLKQRIDDHNAKYELNPYSNRKRGIELKDEVKLAELVPDGVAD